MICAAFSNALATALFSWRLSIMELEHELPLAFYQDYKGVLVTDGLQLYHLVEQKLDGLINANCKAYYMPYTRDEIMRM